MRRRPGAVDFCVGALVALFVGLSFAPAARNGFTVDDDAYVGPAARAEPGLAGLRWALTTTRAEFYHPVTWASFLADRKLNGLAPRSLHVTNLLLHALTSGALYLLLVGLTDCSSASAAMVLLFALHPMRVESVAWIAERKGLLSGLFAVLSVLAYCGAPARATASAALFALSLLAKPAAILLPFCLLGLDAWPLGRIADRKSLGRRLAEKWPHFALAALSAIATLWAQRINLDAPGGLSFGLRLSRALLWLGAYAVRSFAWPAWSWGISLAGFEVPEASGRLVAVCAVASAGAAALGLLRARRGRPALALLSAFFLLGLLPILGLLSSPRTASDKYAYFAHAMIAIPIAVAVAGLTRRRRWAALSILSLLILGLLRSSRAQLELWRDQASLCEYRASVWPGAAWPRNELGSVWLSRGEPERARAVFSKAVAAHPDYFRAWNNLGLTLIKLGNPGAGADAIAKAVSIRHDLLMDYNLAVALLRDKRPAQALPAAQRGLAMPNPDDRWCAHAALGEALLRLGRRTEARTEFERAAAAAPGAPERELLRKIAAGHAPTREELDRVEPLIVMTGN